MRLTLRTLLAYRDRVLNPAEIESLHARVQQSVLASNLIKRIDALSQRTNLLAPPVEGRGLGADANSIAEYLDDTLAGDKVPELERICLESDVQLAELAQCHQLLSDGLSASVEVPKELRQRIVALSDPGAKQAALERRRDRAAEELEPPPKAADSGKFGSGEHHLASPEGRDGGRDRAASTGRPSRFRTDPAHTPAAGNGKEREMVAATIVTAQPVASPMVASGGDSIRTRGLDLEGAHLAHEVPEYLRGRTRAGWLGPLAIGGLVAVLCLLVWLSIGSWDSVRDMLVARSDDSTPLATNSGKSTNAKDNSVLPTAPGSISKEPASSTEAIKNPSVVAMPDALPSQPLPDSPDAQADALDASSQRNVIPAADSALSWLPMDDQAKQAVVLVQADRQLFRLKPGESVGSAQPIFVPPEYRPQLELSGGTTWNVAGLSHLSVALPSTADGRPEVNLQLGRAVVTSSTVTAGIELTTPAGKASVHLKDSQTKVAIELSYPAASFGPVIDRNAHPATLMIMVLEGSARIETAMSPVELAANQALTLSGSQLAQSQPPAPPTWIDASYDRPVDQLAASDLASQLTDGVQVGSKLLELASNRRPEMRALAAQTLALLGSWDWVVSPKSSLNNTRDRSFWPQVLDRTRQVLAAHPENVEALKVALTALDNQSALWRLNLWLGLTLPQIENEAPSQLVKSLESDALIERVLAISELERITGKDLGFQSEEGGRAPAQAWARELSSGRIPLLAAPK